MPPKPGASPVGEPGKADPEAPGDEDKDAKAAKLRERVRERLVGTPGRRRGGSRRGGRALDQTRSRGFPDRRGGGGREASQDRRRRGSLRPRSRRAGRADFVDPETESRRRRVEAWRAGRKALGTKKNVPAFGDDESDESEGTQRAGLGGSGRSPWSRLEDESDEDGPPASRRSPSPRNENENENESADEEDPLEAFMSLNDSVMDAERDAAAAAAGGEGSLARAEKSGEAGARRRCGDRGAVRRRRARAPRAPPRGGGGGGGRRAGSQIAGGRGRRCASLKV